ncbi:CHASE2 domain-containing protein [Devosia faecipullorum]|uniref:CHASE2 domain-containing protein n=1 Tax=Devosia faecipullorum TaxID=2755039 RepID=UPI00187B82E0|nr:CHASE2 domain-containing protein [Devosia faecipullorum]MBE7734606.1 CHASE2 domain-containing protein [Devosia faecipullorum]
MRWFLTGLAVALVALSSFLGFWDAADARLSGLRFSAADRAPSGDFVFVDIDARSLSEVGVWPWPRSVHADLLDRLMDLGVYEVAFDIDFSTASNAENDRSFSEGLKAAGGYAYLAAFRQTSANGAIVFNQPRAEFSEFADAVFVNVDSPEAGLVRAIPALDVETGIPSIAKAFVPNSGADETVRIDYSINLQTVPRIAAVEVLNGAVDPTAINDKQVIIGASAIELHDLFAVPRFGIIAGPMVQIAAAETLKLRRNLSATGPWPALAMLVLVAIAVIALTKACLPWVIAILAASIIGGEIASWAALAWLTLDIVTMPLHVGCLALLISRVFQDRIIRGRQLKEQRARTAYIANHDVRTGAMSRTAWIDALDAQHDTGISNWAMLLQLERLENAGASLGHEVVEAAVAMVYARLTRHVRGFVARIDGDSFAVSWRMPLTLEDIHHLLDALEHPYEVGAHRLAIKVRWGMSDEITANTGASEGLQQARMALASAKTRGLRGSRHDSSLEAELRHRQFVDIGLRQAIAKGELDIAFQAQVDMRSRQVVGAEALLRWTSGELGRISPADFIPMAEENGSIVALGAWIFEESCRRAVQLGWSGSLSINVSPVQFQHSDVVGMIQAAVSATGFPLQRIDVEVVPRQRPWHRLRVEL